MPAAWQNVDNSADSARINVLVSHHSTLEVSVSDNIKLASFLKLIAAEQAKKRWARMNRVEPPKSAPA